MSNKVYEGQLDFLGLLNEYTDSQGATVRVREPGNSRLKPVEKSSSRFKVSEADPEQLKLDFGALSEPTEVKTSKVNTEEIKPTETVVKESAPVKIEPVTQIPVMTEPASEEKVKAEPVKQKTIKEEIIKAEPAKAAPVKEAPVKAEPDTEEPIKAKPAVATAPKPEAVKEQPVSEPLKTEPLKEEKTVQKPKSSSSKGGDAEILFKQCKKCWCHDCKHNSRNEGIPRDICGTKMPCPACESCISEDQATICEIGNAKEGCKLRAIEEGIFTEEEPIE